MSQATAGTRVSVGVLTSIQRFPVKSMLGEELQVARLTSKGVLGDRVLALVDDETGKVVSVKRPRRWGGMFELTATTSPDGVCVTFPDGRAWSAADPELPARLSDFFGRSVSVASVPPPDARFEETWEAELKNGVPPSLGRTSHVDGEDADLVDSGDWMSEQGTFFNFGAVHIVTTSSIRRLAELAPDIQWSADRFRPNLVIDTDDDGFVETDWQNRRLSIGGVTLALTFTVPRCVMTTLQQGDMPADRELLRSVTKHNSVDCWGIGTAYPCVGIYADVVVEGEVQLGQPVLLSDRRV